MRKLIFILPFLLASCVTQKACLDKFPPVTQTIVEYRDTTITVYLPATDTIIKYGTITDTLYVNNGSAHSVVWVKDDTIFNQVFSTDSTIFVKLDSALQVIKVKEQFIKEVTKTGWLTNVKHILLIIAGIFVLVIIYKIIQ